MIIKICILNQELFNKDFKDIINYDLVINFYIEYLY